MVKRYRHYHDNGQLEINYDGPEQWRGRRTATGEEKVFRTRCNLIRWHDTLEAAERKLRAGLKDMRHESIRPQPTPAELRAQRDLLTARW